MAESLDQIIDAIMADSENAEFKEKGWQPVIQAPPTAKILIASQAPGRLAQESGRPFDDPSGRLLRQWLGVDEKEFYDSGYFGIVPMDYFFPGKAKQGDKGPRKDFAKKWNDRLLATMPDLQLTVLIGNYAMKYYLGSEMERNLTETVRHYDCYLPEYFPIVHPSPLNIGWRKKNPWFEEEVVADLQDRVHHIMQGNINIKNK